jgi:hypothetical protein
MNKQTKTLVMVGVVGVGAYLILKQMKPKASFSGGVKSKRMRGLVGVADNMNVKNSNWLRPDLNGRVLANANGKKKKRSMTGVQNNMNVKNSQWVRPALNGQKLSLTGVNQNANVMASPFSWK